MEKEKAIKILEGLAYDYDRIACLTMDSDADVKAEAIRMAIGVLEGTCKAENGPTDERNYSDGITISVGDNTASKRPSKPYGLYHYIDDKILATFVVDKKDESILFYIGKVLKNVRDE